MKECNSNSVKDYDKDTLNAVGDRDEPGYSEAALGVIKFSDNDKSDHKSY